MVGIMEQDTAAGGRAVSATKKRHPKGRAGQLRRVRKAAARPTPADLAELKQAWQEFEESKGDWAKSR
jgi:hypothetical protein